MKPKIRHEAKSSIQLSLENAFQNIYIYQCCLNCENFVEKTELCLLVNKRPPVRILTYGCEAWIERDTIPF